VIDAQLVPFALAAAVLTVTPGQDTMLVVRMRRLFLTFIVRRWLDGICGTLFIGFGVHLAFERR
jgi:threonine/homoserine/homoserine lactone efflux protein